MLTLLIIYQPYIDPFKTRKAHRGSEGSLCRRSSCKCCNLGIDTYKKGQEERDKLLTLNRLLKTTFLMKPFGSGASFSFQGHRNVNEESHLDTTPTKHFSAMNPCSLFISAMNPGKVQQRLVCRRQLFKILALEACNHPDFNMHGISGNKPFT